MVKIRYGYCAVGGPMLGIQPTEVNRKEGSNALKRIGMDKVEYPKLISDFDDCFAAAQFFQQEKVDAVIINFAGAVGIGEVLRLARELNNIPLILWGFGKGPTLTLTILMGVTSTLTKTGNHFSTVIGGPEDTATIEDISSTLKAIDAYRYLQRVNIGFIGYAPPGMVDVGVDEISLRRKIGCELSHLDLTELIQGFQNIQDKEAIPLVDELKSKVGKIAVDDKELLKSSRLYLALKNIIQKYRLNAITIRCWPELRESPPYFHVTPCYAISRLIDEGVIGACEADVSAAVTMLIMNRLTGKSPASLDYNTMNIGRNSLGLWHCGPHALSLAESYDGITVRVPPIGGVVEWGGGCAIEFSIKEGEATLAKLTQEYEKMSIAIGKFVKPSPVMRGGIGEIVMNTNAHSYLEKIIEEGFEHHICAVHGNLESELIKVCKLFEVQPLSF